MSHHTSDKIEKLLQEYNVSGSEVREQSEKKFLNLSALAVREKAVTLFLILAIAAAGVFAFLKLERAEDRASRSKCLRSQRCGPGRQYRRCRTLLPSHSKSACRNYGTTIAWRPLPAPA